MKKSNLKRAVLLRTSPFVPPTSFQPFFTTKPTGQDTGLGLKCSYDIVTKGHGGTLKLSSQVVIGTKVSIKWT